MDRIYKIGGHCFALPDERLMEAVDGISGFKPFVWQPDLVSAKDVYEGYIGFKQVLHTALAGNLFQFTVVLVFGRSGNLVSSHYRNIVQQ